MAILVQCLSCDVLKGGARLERTIYSAVNKEVDSIVDGIPTNLLLEGITTDEIL